MAIYGYNTIGGTAETLAADWKRACKFTTGSDMGIVTDISAYLDRAGGGGSYAATAAIFTDNVGVPADLVANSVLVLTSNVTRNAPSWYSFAYLSTPPIMAPSTVYWLCVLGDKMIKTHWDSGASNQQAENADTIPYDDPFGTVSTYQAQNMSIFVTYTPGDVTVNNRVLNVIVNA